MNESESEARLQQWENFIFRAFSISHEKIVIHDFQQLLSSYSVKSKQHNDLIISLKLLNESKDLWSQIEAVHEASDLRCHFCDHFS
jgi:chemotaxis regulatin CheY-phosphate phosphatase CheZ